MALRSNLSPGNCIDSRVALSGAWAKDYGRGTESSYFFRHILRPEVSYTGISPGIDPQRYPEFDPLDQGWVARANRNLPVREGDDPIGGVNALTYGISNNILWRSQNEQGQTTVRDVLWFRLSQTSFFNKSSMGLDGNSEPHHPFSDFWAELQFYPMRQIILGANVGVSPYSEGFDRADFKVTILGRRRGRTISISIMFMSRISPNKSTSKPI